MKNFLATLILGCSFSVSAFAASSTGEAPLLFSADLALVANAATTPSGTAPPFYAKQCAKQAAPGSPSNASGKATLLYYPKTKTLVYAIAYNALSGPAMMAHFHSSATAANPIVQTLCGMPPPDENGLGHSAHTLNGKHCPTTNYGFFKQEYVLKGNPSLKMTAEQEEEQLMAGKLFLNFHTCLNMGGEIQGPIQLVGGK